MQGNVQFDVRKNEAGQPSVYARVGEETIELSPLWIRERCQDKDSLDQRTKQRLFNPHDLSPDLRLEDAKLDAGELFVLFSDGYRGTYELAPLLEDFDELDGCPAAEPWRAATVGDMRFSWPSLLESEESFLACLDRFFRAGFVILEETPVSPGTIIDVAQKFGNVRDTNFGRVFEVYARPNPDDANDLAYTALRLDPHTDNPYRDPVPGIQLLHCLANEASGGLSTLSDSLAATEELRRRNPEGFDLLCTVPIRYRFWDRTAELVARQTMICRDHLGRVTGIHYSPKLDHLPLLAPDKVRVYHEARRDLTRMISSDEFEYRFQLRGGELVMFDNNRILHGRTSFDISSGLRHLQGCYIDRDEPRSRYRLLRRAATQ